MAIVGLQMVTHFFGSFHIGIYKSVLVVGILVEMQRESALFLDLGSSYPIRHTCPCHTWSSSQHFGNWTCPHWPSCTGRGWQPAAGVAAVAAVGHQQIGAERLPPWLRPRQLPPDGAALVRPSL